MLFKKKSSNFYKITIIIICLLEDKCGLITTFFLSTNAIFFAFFVNFIDLTARKCRNFVLFCVRYCTVRYGTKFLNFCKIRPIKGRATTLWVELLLLTPKSWYRTVPYCTVLCGTVRYGMFFLVLFLFRSERKLFGITRAYISTYVNRKILMQRDSE